MKKFQAKRSNHAGKKTNTTQKMLPLNSMRYGAVHSSRRLWRTAIDVVETDSVPAVLQYMYLLFAFRRTECFLLTIRTSHAPPGAGACACIHGFGIANEQ